MVRASPPPSSNSPLASIPVIGPLVGGGATGTHGSTGTAGNPRPPAPGAGAAAADSPAPEGGAELLSGAAGTAAQQAGDTNKETQASGNKTNEIAATATAERLSQTMPVAGSSDGQGKGPSEKGEAAKNADDQTRLT